jgi:hypothetical protein
VKAAAGVVLLLACTAASQADVVIHSRSSEYYLRSTRYIPWSPWEVIDRVDSVNQLSGSGDDTVTFGSVTSSASPSALSASLGGYEGHSSPYHDFYSTYSTSSFCVVFGVTDVPIAITMFVGPGSIFPAGQPGGNRGLSLSIVNFGTGELVFDLYTDAPPARSGYGLASDDWADVSWTGILAPGTYILRSEARPVGTYSAGGGSDSHGGGSFTFSATFGPAVAPATAPSPAAAAALLALAGTDQLRRRRRPGGVNA